MAIMFKKCRLLHSLKFLFLIKQYPERSLTILVNTNLPKTT
ncbi:hypothetical protein ILUMI_02347 [Ignelater luminosus]|uniref:Uncharacterized protein n=1 Tax=Ignelater luminosus TaxID=2038154 RepID=A0A8K0DIB4_IGNLU|nr:hypothetical protein ILUMI_02347 [Ignelater luminosus]